MTLQQGNLLQSGKYKVIRVLGQGGFGITYEAEQVSLGRRVAVKEFFMKDSCERVTESSEVSVPTVSNRELVSKFKQKFIREAQMIAAMDHDHIVRIHDVFEENGTAYYVMEYLPGGSLADVVKHQGALNESTAIDYISQIADALKYLHEQNTLHLDVKPSNVLLNQKGQLKLIDFGISKHYDEEGSQTSSTPVGISKGYAPLEQYQQGGDISKFTPATDIYALGATLYYLVTGAVPPDASEVNEDGLPVMSGISKPISDAIEKAMSPRKKDRHQSVEAFLCEINIAPQIETKPLINKSDFEHKDGKNEETVVQEYNSLVRSQESANYVGHSENSGKAVSHREKKSHLWRWIILAFITILVPIFAIVLLVHQAPQVRDKITINGLLDYSVSFTSDGGTQIVSIKKNFNEEWDYTELPSWLSINTSHASARIICKQNRTYKTRTAVIHLFKKGSNCKTSAKITVSQSASKKTSSANRLAF